MKPLTRPTRLFLQWTLLVVFGFVAVVATRAQSTPATRQSGTVKSAAADSFVLTTAAGQDVTVAVPSPAKVLIVAPGSHDLSAATPGSVSDIQAGDRALVTGTPGDSATTLNASRVILMKSSAIAETHAAEEQAWARGGGGIVKSVDPAAGKIVISSGLRTITVQTTPSTILRRYSNGSVRFEDAVKSTVAAIQPGDQLRVRGSRSADGSSITADEIVTGSFNHFSGLLSAVDTTAGTVSVKDLSTKKTVVIAVSPDTDIRMLPPQAAQMIAARMRGGSNPGAGASRAGSAAHSAAPAQPDSDSTQGARRAAAGVGLSQMLSRLPAGTLSELKPGDAVMIVAASAGTSGHPSAVTLLEGVEPILTAPSGDTMTLTPWSVGGGAPDAGGESGGASGAGPGR